MWKMGRFCAWHLHCFADPRKTMDVSLYQAAAAMSASTRWQETIADNLASSQIPGFKKQEMSFSAVQAGFMPRTPGASPLSANRVSMPQAGATTNFQAGELRPTNVPTDFALEGKGLFAVQMPDGTQGYTRDGEFQISPQGQLITKRGMPVLGDNGPIQLDENKPGSFIVAPTGEVSQNGISHGRLKLVEFNDPGALATTSTGMLVNTNPAIQPQTTPSTTVRQGFLEGANTSPMLEMSNLISAMRLFEANQKVIQTEDDRVNRLITDVANAT